LKYSVSHNPHIYVSGVTKQFTTSFVLGTVVPCKIALTSKSA
jgi:hypothetical protein